MKRSHESRSTHSLGFAFILWCFIEYISSKIVNFFLKYYGLFRYSKRSRSPITASKMFHITAPWPQSKHPLSCHNGFVMLSRQLFAIDTKQSCDKQPGSFIQDPGIPGSFTQDPGGGKNGYFNSKTESSHTSQDKKYYIQITLISVFYWRINEYFIMNNSSSV